MKNNKKYIVYIHKCPNNKIYIGITSREPQKRWKNGEGYIDNKHFYRAIKKYGWNNIEHKILFKNLDENEAYEKEKQLIKELESNNYKKGYNKSIGGEKSALGFKQTKETREKMSENNARYWKGKKMPDKTKEKISNSLKGRAPWNKGTHEINSGCFKKGNVPWIKGKKMSQEFIEKNRLGHLGKHSSPKTEFKPKIVLCIETSEIYNGTIEASKMTNICQSSIAKACRGVQETAGGLHWKYINKGVD